MILDDGICTVFSRVNTAERGHMPVYDYIRKAAGWYKALDFATTAQNVHQGKESIQQDLKIRVLQNRAISTHDVVAMGDVGAVPMGADVYEITRVYHGKDDLTAVPISDISLVVMKR